MNLQKEVQINKTRLGLTDQQASLLEHLFSFCFYGCYDERTIMTWADRIKAGTEREYVDSETLKLMDSHARMYECLNHEEDVNGKV